MGRFLTKDPIRDGLNWYAYCRNNPMGFVDPTGLLTDDHREALRNDLSKYRGGSDFATYKAGRTSHYEGVEREAIQGQMDFMASSSEFNNEGIRGILYKMMGDYNRDVVPADVKEYGGENATLSGGFEAIKGYEGIEDPHPGINWTGSEGIRTPFYTVYEKSTLNQGSNPVVLSVPGTDFKMRIKHADRLSVQGLIARNKNNKGVLGALLFAPGQKIMDFPLGNVEEGVYLMYNLNGEMQMTNLKIVVEKHPDCYVAYPLGIEGVVVGEGDTYEDALADVKSAIKFHMESFGNDMFTDDDPVLEAFVAEAVM